MREKSLVFNLPKVPPNFAQPCCSRIIYWEKALFLSFILEVYSIPYIQWLPLYVYVKETDFVDSSYEVGTKKGECFCNNLCRWNRRTSRGYHPLFAFLLV